MSSGASKETSQETSVVASSKTLSPHSHGSTDIATATTAGSVTNLDAASKRKNNNRSNNNKNKRNNNKKPRRSSPSASDKSKYSARSQGYGPASSQFAASGEVGDVPHPGSHASALYAGGEASSSSKEKEERSPHPKRKLAFLLSFCGKSYGGMQMNVGVRTIQAEVERAFFETGMLSLSNYGYPRKYGWSNSARTDKGVHAAAQVCSAKVLVPTPGEDLDELRVRVNERLPSDICLLDVKKVTKSFQAKTARDKVRYQYMVPSYLLRPREEVRKVFEDVLAGKKGSFEQVVGDEEATKVMDDFRSYRAPADVLQKVDSVFKKYEGTKKYHNYTNSKSYTDASAARYMMSFVRAGVVEGDDGMEWVAVAVTGQAFLLHQIRKMVSMAVDVVRGAATEEQMDRSFGDGVVKLSIAPSQGLFLDMSYFDLYCARSTFAHEKLEWGENGSEATKRWEEFKREKIVKHILEEESKEKNFLQYIYNQEFHFYSPNCYKFYEGQKNGGNGSSGKGEDEEEEED